MQTRTCPVSPGRALIALHKCVHLADCICTYLQAPGGTLLRSVSICVVFVVPLVRFYVCLCDPSRVLRRWFDPATSVAIHVRVSTHIR